ncbi:uncharacterized protein PgNI_02889 [Pyricularia grisea]|uniref:Uncharacterized protein n=1 Tax=Pyricularia grisea TaxID=148305 RepID=A0A6P8BA47_PYRGI|nr:uncharacterized protein PgNI_02889 [Pyricularia grisea]TLD12684.1 hypothetical protein PgNI_02889 [Pyricularia grisea]
MAVFDSLPKRPVGRPRRDGKPAGSVPKASSGRPRGRPRNDGLPAGSVKRPQGPTATPMAPTMVPHLGTPVAPSMAPSIALSMALSLAPPITPPITPPSAPPSQPPAPARPSGPVPASQILMNLHLFQPIIPAPEPTISPFRPGSSEYEYKCIEPPPQTINPAYLTLSNHKPGGMYLHRRRYNPRPDPSDTRPEAACRPELTPEQELVIFRRERDAEMERVVAHAREVADRVVADMPVDEEWDTAPEFAPGRWPGTVFGRV